MTGPNRWSDGNGLAGPLQDAFAVDFTAAVGRFRQLRPHRTHGGGAGLRPCPGVIARCPICDQVVLRLYAPPAAPGETCAA